MRRTDPDSEKSLFYRDPENSENNEKPRKTPKNAENRPKNEEGAGNTHSPKLFRVFRAFSEFFVVFGVFRVPAENANASRLVVRAQDFFENSTQASQERPQPPS